MIYLIEIYSRNGVTTRMFETSHGARINKAEPLKGQTCLVIFCKRPTLFQGKQRLAKTIGAKQCLTFAQSFLNCALEDAREWPGPVILSPSSPQDTEWASRLLERDSKVMAQPEGGLGHRIQMIDRQLRAEGYSKIVFIGTDAPALRPDHYEEARKEISLTDVVLGPASDGGVVIMGSSVPWPDLRPLPWSTTHLGSALAKTCLQQGLGVTNISPGYDIDVEADFLKLVRDLSDDPRPARQCLYQQLREFLQQGETRYA